jgi:hypothetical protein
MVHLYRSNLPEANKPRGGTSGEKSGDFTVSSIQFLGDHEPVRRVMFAGREIVDANVWGAKPNCLKPSGSRKIEALLPGISPRRYYAPLYTRIPMIL